MIGSINEINKKRPNDKNAVFNDIFFQNLLKYIYYNLEDQKNSKGL